MLQKLSLYLPQKTQKIHIYRYPYEFPFHNFWVTNRQMGLPPLQQLTRYRIYNMIYHLKDILTVGLFAGIQ